MGKTTHCTEEIGIISGPNMRATNVMSRRPVFNFMIRVYAKYRRAEMDAFAFVWAITTSFGNHRHVLDECVVALNSRVNPYCVDTESRDHQKLKIFLIANCVTFKIDTARNMKYFGH